MEVDRTPQPEVATRMKTIRDNQLTPAQKGNKLFGLFSTIPSEVHISIVEYMEPSSIKSLKLASRQLNEITSIYGGSIHKTHISMYGWVGNATGLTDTETISKNIEMLEHIHDSTLTIAKALLDDLWPMSEYQGPEAAPVWRPIKEELHEMVVRLTNRGGMNKQLIGVSNLVVLPEYKLKTIRRLMLATAKAAFDVYQGTIEYPEGMPQEYRLKFEASGLVAELALPTLLRWLDGQAFSALKH
jgi:hypothetical protein